MNGIARGTWCLLLFAARRQQNRNVLVSLFTCLFCVGVMSSDSFPRIRVRAKRTFSDVKICFVWTRQINFRLKSQWKCGGHTILHHSTPSWWYDKIGDRIKSNDDYDDKQVRLCSDCKNILINRIRDSSTLAVDCSVWKMKFFVGFLLLTIGVACSTGQFATSWGDVINAKLLGEQKVVVAGGLFQIKERTVAYRSVRGSALIRMESDRQWLCRFDFRTDLLLFAELCIWTTIRKHVLHHLYPRAELVILMWPFESFHNEVKESIQ